MKDEQEPVMNGWLWSLLAAACFFGLGNIVYGAEKKQPLEVIVAAFERCMDTEGSCKDKARPVTIDGIKGVALDVRDERGEPLQCAILELKGERRAKRYFDRKRVLRPAFQLDNFHFPKSIVKECLPIAKRQV